MVFRYGLCFSLVRYEMKYGGAPETIIAERTERQTKWKVWRRVRGPKGEAVNAGERREYEDKNSGSGAVGRRRELQRRGGID